jgi:hypothetical protein
MLEQPMELERMKSGNIELEQPLKPEQPLAHNPKH